MLRRLGVAVAGRRGGPGMAVRWATGASPGNYLENCNSTLELIHNAVDALADGPLTDQIEDVAYESGVLSVHLRKVGTYVLNRQAPNRQIWLSSPLSGPAHYDMVEEGDAVRWLDTNDRHDLLERMRKEFRELYQQELDFSDH
eukprot:EG_transcript_32001